MNPLYGRDKERFLIGRILGLKVTTKIKVKTRKRKGNRRRTSFKTVVLAEKSYV